MKFKNEIIIKTKLKEYKMHNTMTILGLQAIAEFKQYGKFLAIGTGRQTPIATVEHLQTFHSLYDTKIIDYNFDVTNGNLYVTRTAEVVPAETIAMTELGLVRFGNDRTKLVNYVLVVDENGNEDSVTINANESVYVSVKIVIELDSSKWFFLSGENKFAASLLGAGTFNSNTNFRLYNGWNLALNSQKISCATPDMSELGGVAAEYSYEISNTAPYSLVMNFKGLDVFSCYPYKFVPEILLFADGEPVARYSLMEMYETTGRISKTSTVLGTVDFGYKIKDISLITVSKTGVELSGYSCDKQYFQGFSYSEVFSADSSITYETQRYISADASKIAFLVDGELIAYKNENGALTKLTTLAFINKPNIKNIVIVDDYVFVLFCQTNAFVDLYKFENNILVQKSITNTGLSNIITESSFLSIDASVCANGTEIRFCVVQDDQTKEGYVLKYSIDANGDISYAGYIDSGLPKCIDSLYTHKNFFGCDCIAAFLTNNYGQNEMLRITTVEGLTIKNLVTQTICAAVINNVSRRFVLGDILCAEKSSGNNAIEFLVLSGNKRYYILKENYTKLAFNGTFRQFAMKLATGNWKFSHYTNFSSNRVVTATFPFYSIPNDTIQDVVFLKDLALVFTNSLQKRVMVVHYHGGLSIINNLPASTSVYITSTYYNLPASDATDRYVRSKLTLEVS